MTEQILQEMDPNLDFREEATAEAKRSFETLDPNLDFREEATAEAKRFFEEPN